MSPREKTHLCHFLLFSVFKAATSESVNKGQLQHSRGERLIFVLCLPLCFRAMGRSQQQHRYGQPGGGQARDPGGTAWGVLEIPDAPQPASVPQVQHLLGQGCTVRGLHSQRAAAIPCTGAHTLFYLQRGHSVKSFQGKKPAFIPTVDQSVTANTF